MFLLCVKDKEELGTQVLTGALGNDACNTLTPFAFICMTSNEQCIKYVVALAVSCFLIKRPNKFKFNA